MKTQSFVRAGYLFLAVLLPLALTGGRPVLPAPAAGPEKAASLPLGSQAPISALIGADQSVYHERLAGAHFRMDNPGQGLSAEFTANGMQVSAGVHSWGLTLEGYGYGESLQPLPAVDPTSRDNRLEYARGPLTEWYLNGPFGLEQGFTLVSPPAVMTGGALTLALSQVGDLQAAVGAGGKELVLSAASGEAVLRYAGLAAYDADGRELQTWLETRAGVNGRPPLLLLRLDEHGVRYPLTVDPFVQTAKLTASDKDFWENFGESVAISGGVVVVGAPDAAPGGTDAAGAAYVFVKPVGGWGNMTQKAKLTASDMAEDDNFGFSVAVSGGVVVVGAPSNSPGGTNDAGAAYVFVKPVGGWGDMIQTAKLTASDKAVDDYFGDSVAVSGSVVVVGAPFASPGGTSSAGAAYVFVKPVGGWGDMTQTARLTASDKDVCDFFGSSVAISGSVVVVGAPLNSPGGTTSTGATYIFVKPVGGWGNMTQKAKLTASDKAAGDYFGGSVAISGDVVVVGAPYADPGGTGTAGAAYVFVKPGGGWANMTQTAKLTASDKAAGDWFGISVAISGDVVVVGAEYADPGGTIDAGAAYMFENVIIANFRSQGAYDGYILESGESSSVGGTVNVTASTFRVGDNGLDRQYRSLLSFNTSTLPDNAVINSVALKIKKQGLVGTNPFTTHQGLKVDIRKPFFGATLALVAGDFQAAASKSAVGTFGSTPVSGWYSVKLNSSAYAYVNKTGTTQFRLRFLLDDNDDLGDDYVMFYSGNWSTAADRPLLIVQYIVP